MELIISGMLVSVLVALVGGLILTFLLNTDKE